MPVDVDAYRVSPTGDRIAFSMSVFRDCAGPGLHQGQGRRERKGQGHRQGLRPPVRAPLGYLGRRPQRRAVLGAARRQRPRERRAGQPVRLAGRRRALEALRRPRGIPLQPGRQDRRVLGAHRRQDRSLVDQLRPVFGAGRRAASAAQPDRGQPGLGHQGRVLAGRPHPRLPVDDASGLRSRPLPHRAARPGQRQEAQHRRELGPLAGQHPVDARRQVPDRRRRRHRPAQAVLDRRRQRQGHAADQQGLDRRLRRARRHRRLHPGQPGIAAPSCTP